MVLKLQFLRVLQADCSYAVALPSQLPVSVFYFIITILLLNRQNKTLRTLHYVYNNIPGTILQHVIEPTSSVLCIFGSIITGFQHFSLVNYYVSGSVLIIQTTLFRSYKSFWKILIIFKKPRENYLEKNVFGSFKEYLGQTSK